jgi:hypothetical protein
MPWDMGRPREGPTRDQVNLKLVKSEQDQLYYSRKARSVSFVPCTTKEYLRGKPTEYYELGKLRPPVDTEEVLKRREKNQRMKAYGDRVKQISLACLTSPGPAEAPEGGAFVLPDQQRSVFHPAPQQRQESLNRQRKSQSARQRGIEFARHVPRPRVRTALAASTAAAEPDRTAKMSELEALERTHDRAREEIEKIRQSFGM